MPDTISVNEQDNNRSLSLDVGTILIVTLRENATTGFKWHMEQYDQNILSMESDTYSMSSTSGIGGGGSRSLTFRAIAPGQTVLRLLKRRAWEPPENFADQFMLNVSVQ